MAASSPATVDFHGTPLLAVEIDGVPHVALKQICDALTVDWSSQLQRLKRSPILAEGMVVTTMPSRRGEQETVVIPLNLLNGWLFGITTARVRDPSLRERLVQYQRECFAVLAAHFQGKSAARPTPISASSYENNSADRVSHAFHTASVAAMVAQKAIFTDLLAHPDGASDRVSLLSHIAWDGKAHSQVVEPGSFVTSLDRLPQQLAARDTFFGVTDAQLLAIAHAALARLGDRHGVPAPRSGSYADQGPEVLGVLAVRPGDGGG